MELGPFRNPGDDYLLDRQAQKTRSFTGIEGLSEQDAAIQDSQGPSRTARGVLGATDLGIVRFWRLILSAARIWPQGRSRLRPPRRVPIAFAAAAPSPRRDTRRGVLRARFGSDIGKVPQMQS